MFDREYKLKREKIKCCTCISRNGNIYWENYKPQYFRVQLTDPVQESKTIKDNNPVVRNTLHANEYYLRTYLLYDIYLIIISTVEFLSYIYFSVLGNVRRLKFNSL